MVREETDDKIDVSCLSTRISAEMVVADLDCLTGADGLVGERHHRLVRLLELLANLECAKLSLDATWLRVVEWRDERRGTRGAGGTAPALGRRR
jgi:hypothetical protein